MELHYFLTTNGSKGHYSFLDKEISAYRQVIRLSGYPRPIATALIRECYTIAKQNRMNMHIIHNCLDNSTEGILFPDLRAAMVNVPIYEHRFDVASLFKNEPLDMYNMHLQKAFSCFCEAKEIHDDWEKIYINNTNFEALNQFTEKIVNELIKSHRTDHPGSFCDRFFGAATINGSLDYIDILTEGCKRYFIKGRPGTGKSTFMKKIAQAAFDRGFHVERYHCSFDPDSLDMIAIRELSLCLFDSTAPHEYFPSRETDEILDLYTIAVLPETDENFKPELTAVSKQYKEAIDRGIKSLIAANSACQLAEEIYRKMIDNNALMGIRKMAIQKIFP